MSIGGGFVLALIPKKTTTKKRGDDSSRRRRTVGRKSGVSRRFERDSPLRLMLSLLEYGSQSDDGRSTKISYCCFGLIVC